jgi:hypothetical protein
MNVGTVINAVPGEAEATVNGKKYDRHRPGGPWRHAGKRRQRPVKVVPDFKPRNITTNFWKLMQLMTKTGLNIDLADAQSVLTLAPSLATVDGYGRQKLNAISVSRCPCTMRTSWRGLRKPWRLPVL